MKVRSGKWALDPSKINVRQVLKSIVNLQTCVANKSGVALEAKIGDAVPEGAILDQMKVTQILNNLLSNAIKFTPKDKKVIIIIVLVVIVINCGPSVL